MRIDQVSQMQLMTVYRRAMLLPSSTRTISAKFQELASKCRTRFEIMSCGTFESVKVHDVRLYQGMGSELLEKLLGGVGAERGIGGKVWTLINGIDDSEVKEARKLPSQISIEDSYTRLDTMAQIRKE